jgi:Tat protein translocase TatB subunit
MNFLGIGPFELLLVLVIATIVLGPERMARAGRMLGRLYAQYRTRWQRDVDDMTRELQRELQMLQQEMDEIRQAAENEFRATEAEIKAAEAEIEKTQSFMTGVVEEARDLTSGREVAPTDGNSAAEGDEAATVVQAPELQQIAVQGEAETEAGEVSE